jgi:hypothetical protein
MRCTSSRALTDDNGSLNLRPMRAGHDKVQADTNFRVNIASIANRRQWRSISTAMASHTTSRSTGTGPDRRRCRRIALITSAIDALRRSDFNRLGKSRDRPLG